METLGALGGETWFRLGDRDLALHVERTRRLRAGETLSAITADICRRLGIAARVLPMSDDPRAHARAHATTAGSISRIISCASSAGRSCASWPSTARTRRAPQPDIMAALKSGKVRAVVICPSNPFISIEPILAVPGMRAALAGCGAPVVAVSPIVGGRAVKGPTAKMMQELGLPVSAAAVAARYGDLLDGYVVDTADAEDGARAKVHARAHPDDDARGSRATGAHRPRLCADSARSRAPPTSGRSCRQGAGGRQAAPRPPCSRRPSAAR